MADRSRFIPIVALVMTVIVAGLLADASRRLPDISSRSGSTRLLDTDDTRIGRAIASAVAKHPDKAGVVALPNGRDAFAARALLAHAAERSLVVQYYILEHDISGTLLYDALHRGRAWSSREAPAR
jgi:putative cardiolipin synthase